jgi:hypothetical protein
MHVISLKTKKIEMEATNHINLKYSIIHMWIHKSNTKILLELAIELRKQKNKSNNYAKKRNAKNKSLKMASL